MRRRQGLFRNASCCVDPASTAPIAAYAVVTDASADPATCAEVRAVRRGQLLRQRVRRPRLVRCRDVSLAGQPPANPPPSPSSPAGPPPSPANPPPSPANPPPSPSPSPANPPPSPASPPAHPEVYTFPVKSVNLASSPAAETYRVRDLVPVHDLHDAHPVHGVELPDGSVVVVGKADEAAASPTTTEAFALCVNATDRAVRWVWRSAHAAAADVANAVAWLPAANAVLVVGFRAVGGVAMRSLAHKLGAGCRRGAVDNDVTRPGGQHGAFEMVGMPDGQHPPRHSLTHASSHAKFFFKSYSTWSRARARWCATPSPACSPPRRAAAVELDAAWTRSSPTANTRQGAAARRRHGRRARLRRRRRRCPRARGAARPRGRRPVDVRRGRLARRGHRPRRLQDGVGRRRAARAGPADTLSARMAALDVRRRGAVGALVHVHAVRRVGRRVRQAHQERVLGVRPSPRAAGAGTRSRAAPASRTASGTPTRRRCSPTARPAPPTRSRRVRAAGGRVAVDAAAHRRGRLAAVAARR